MLLFLALLALYFCPVAITLTEASIETGRENSEGIKAEQKTKSGSLNYNWRCVFDWQGRRQSRFLSSFQTKTF